MTGLMCALALAGTLELAVPASEHSFVLDTRVDIALATVATMSTVAVVASDQMIKPSVRRQSDFTDPLTFGTPYQDGVFGKVAFNPSVEWKTFSDGSLYLVPALALLVPTADIGRAGGLRRAAGRKLVVFESVTLTLAVTSAGKNLVQRPRPFALYQPSAEWQGPGHVYSEDIYDSCDPDLGCTFRDRSVFWSFPSGHTSVVTAAAVSWYTTEMLSAAGPRRWRWFGLAAPLALGGLVGVARVKAGKHRPSDVATGWAIGAVIGLVVPLAHDRGLRVSQGPGDVGLAVSLPL